MKLRKYPLTYVSLVVVIIVVSVVLAAPPNISASAPAAHHPSIGEPHMYHPSAGKKPPHTNAPTAPTSTAQPLAVQLRTRGYAPSSYSSNYNFNTKIAVHAEVWAYTGPNSGTPTMVYLSDAGHQNTYTIVRVSFTPPPGFQGFWCVPDVRDDTNVSAAFDALTKEYNDVLLLGVRPGPGLVDKSDTAVIQTEHCYMR